MPEGRDEEYELVQVSPLKKLEREIKKIKNKDINVPVEKLGDNVEELNEHVSKLITVNINLQAKITELLIKNTELIENVNEMVELLRKASEVEAVGVDEGVGAAQTKLSFDPVVSELRKIGKQNTEMIEGFKRLNEYLFKTYRRGMIEKVMSNNNNQGGA